MNYGYIFLLLHLLLLFGVSAQNFCGSTFDEAVDCAAACPDGTDAACPDGQSCFGGVTCRGVRGEPEQNECGLDIECPLKACCSKFGYCGWTEDFCNDDCQSNCEFDVAPTTGDGGQVMQVRWGYYASWSSIRDCHMVKPSDLSSAAMKYSHLAFSFAHVSDDFRIIPSAPEDIELYREFAELKKVNPALRIIIAVGGWAFNDPPYEARFTTMAATPESRGIFIQSVVEFLREYRFDGIDFDWEYPGADDRGGREEDFTNYVSLISELRNTFNEVNTQYSITMAVPLSNWYLRHFDIQKLAELLDFFNVMSYDIHGVWDAHIPSLGNYVRAHTNMTEIKEGLSMFYKNDVPTSKLVLGLGGYGRTYTLTDSSCSTAGCTFSMGGNPGTCTKAEGFMSYYEIREKLIAHNYANMHFDEESSSMYYVEGDQWISFDNAETFRIKKDYASSLSMGGWMVWSVDMIADGTIHDGSDDGFGEGENVGEGDGGDKDEENGENDEEDEDGEGEGNDDEGSDDENGNDDDDDENDDTDDEDDDDDDSDSDDDTDDDDDSDSDDDSDDDGDNCACQDPTPDKSGALCYPACDKGWRGAGPLCHIDCPAGFADQGLFCRKPTDEYGRGVGYPWKFGDKPFDGDGQIERCEDDHGKDNCEQDGLLVYPKCAEGFVSVGCCICSPACPDGFDDIGISCAKPTAKGRGVGKVLPCVKDFFDNKLSCVADAFNDFKDEYDLKKEFETLLNGVTEEDKKDNKAVCSIAGAVVQSPILIAMQEAVESCTNEGGITVYVAGSGELGKVLKGTVALGVLAGSDGKRGCYISGCGGVGLNAGGSVDLVMGAMMHRELSNFEGASIVLDGDLIGGAAIGFGIPSGIPMIEISIGAGAQVNLGTLSGCYSDVTEFLES